MPDRKPGLIKRSIGALVAVTKHWYDQYSPYGQFWLTIGIIALIVDAALAFQYGVSQTIWHGIGFAVLALVFSQLPDGAVHELEKGNRAVGLFGLICCLPIGVMAYYSHVGYGSGVRVHDMDTARIQNTVHANADKATSEIEGELAIKRRELAELKKKRGWTGVVNAEAKRREIENLEGDKIFKRSKECRDVTVQESRDFCDKRAALQAEVADIESANGTQIRIDTLIKDLNDKRAELAATKHANSTAADQTDALAQVYLLLTGAKGEAAINPDKVTQKFTNLAIVAGGSLAFMLASPVAFLFAGRNRRNRRPEDEIYIATAQMQQTASTPVSAEPMAKAIVPVVKSQPRPSIRTLTVADLINGTPATA